MYVQCYSVGFEGSTIKKIQQNLCTMEVQFKKSDYPVPTGY